MQEDGTVTLMLSVVSGRHTVLNLSAREHERFEGHFRLKRVKTR